MTHEELISTLREQRISHGLHMEDIGHIASCSKNTYNGFELGRCNLASSSLLDLLHYYNLDITITPRRQ